MQFLNAYLVNNEKFVCANCGHERHDHDNREGLCRWRQHGALRACKCYRYEPSEMEKWYAEENRKRSMFPREALRALNLLRKNIHQYHVEDHGAPEHPAHCELCGPYLNQLILTGERAFDCIDPNA